VLHLWRDGLRIALTPERVAAVRLTRGMRPAVVGAECISCDIVPGEPPWQAALSALSTLLSKMDTGSSVATVVLSNRFVRYALVPWNERLTTAEEEMAFAQHCFRETYGESALSWEVRVSPAGTGQPRVASAVDRAMLSAIRQAVGGSSLRLRSVQPLLMAAYNRSRRGLDRRACLFLLAEKRSYACMALVNGACIAVRSGLINGPLKQELPFILDREHVWSGMEERAAAFLYAPEHPDVNSDGTEPQLPERNSAGSAYLDYSAEPLYRIAMTAT
jgi:hypothetical protein